MEKKIRVGILFSPRTFAAMTTARYNIYMVRLSKYIFKEIDTR
jgi:hypothetical protein